MQHLFQSVFLQSLGYAIAHSVWQTALVWLLYISITGLLPMGAAAKYRLGVAAQTIGFVWFLFTFQFYYQQYHQVWQPVKTAADNMQPITATGTGLLSGVLQWMLKGERLLPYISMAYLLLMIFLCVRWFMGYRQTQLIRYQGLHKMPAEWRLFVQKIAAQLNIKKNVRVFLSEQVSTPLTIGFLKPIILVPMASINHLSTQQMEAVLLHEMAHIKRYDYLVNILLSIAEIGLFFNPFTQLISKSIRKERENSCDDWVLQFQYEAPVYAEALLRIAYLQQAPALAMTAIRKKNDLLYRVKRMIEQKENRFSYRKQLLAFFIVTGILSSVAWLSPIRSSRNEQAIASQSKKIKLFTPAKKVQPYTVEPMAIRVDNPLFNPVFFLSKPLQAEVKKNMAAAEKELTTPTKEYPADIVNSFTPMIADALQQASLEIEQQQKHNWQKELAEMEKAKQELARVLSTDSALFTANMRKQFKQEINNGMKKVSADIEKAKAEMQKAFSVNVNIDKTKITRDIQQAMDVVTDLDKMGLDKLILQSLHSVEPLFKEEQQHLQKKTPRHRNNPEKKELPERMVPEETETKEIIVVETPLETMVTAVPEPVVMNEISLQKLVLLSRLAELSSLQQMKLAFAKLTKAKRIEKLPLVLKKRIREEEEKQVMLLQQ
jgi:beta-lactamase regulating signal transducer with metallopeptidase domain